MTILLQGPPLFVQSTVIGKDYIGSMVKFVGLMRKFRRLDVRTSQSPGRVARLEIVEEP